jgi:iron(III) transport system ATP-binding protein
MSIKLEVKNLTKQFGKGKDSITAVDDITFTINEGELFAFLGESGCGKTTTLRMIAGLEKVTDGTILFSDQDYTHVPTNKRGIGMVFQSYALYPHMTIFENVAYGLRVRGTSKEKTKNKVDEVLRIVDLPPEMYSNRRPSELSGGQQQRIALARALVYDPRLLLFDEPLSNLDAKLRVYMREEIRKIQQRLGITAIYVTHDQEEALAISDRVAIMFNGRIDQIGTPVDVYETPKKSNVADFIGKANLLQATLSQKNGSNGLATFPSGETIEGTIAINPELLGTSITVMMRPERIQISALPNDSSKSKSATPEKNTIKAKITKITYLGNRTHYELETSFGVKLTSESVRLLEGLEINSEVSIQVKPNEALLLPSPSSKPETIDL